jgi:N-acetylglutamate synthase
VSSAALAHALAQSWPSARSFDVGPFTLRDGQGGGKRVSAASLTRGDYSAAALDQAEDAMRALGQAPLFVIWPDTPEQAQFDAALAARGYRLIDPCLGYIAPIAQILAHGLDAAQSYAHWPPLALCNDLWQASDIGPARRTIMARVKGPKAVIMARQSDDIAGVCFAAVVGQTAMIHATHVAPNHRRQGSAQKLMQRAAIWAAAQGAVNLGLVVTTENTPARALYDKLGMRVWAGYHYRQLA